MLKPDFSCASAASAAGNLSQHEFWQQAILHEEMGSESEQFLCNVLGNVGFFSVLEPVDYVHQLIHRGRLKEISNLRLSRRLACLITH